MTDDNQMISLIRENAERGFRILMAKYKEPVYWHIRRLVVNHADAQDATQETFVRIFRSFGQYSGEGTFKSWIFRIATNEALRLLGRNQGKTTLTLDETTPAILTMKATAKGHPRPACQTATGIQPEILRRPVVQGDIGRHRLYGDIRQGQLPLCERKDYQVYELKRDIAYGREQ